MARRNVVLDRMHELGRITDKQWPTRRSAPSSRTCASRSPRAPASPRPTPTGATSSSATSLAMPELGKTVEERKRMLYRGGLTIQTTLDPRCSRSRSEEVTKKVADRRQVPRRRGGLRHRARHRARCSPSPRTRLHRGNSRSARPASTGPSTRGYGGSGGFQFGSTAKAFALVTAMESGMTLKRASTPRRPATSPGDLPAERFPGRRLRPRRHVERRQRHPVRRRQHQPHEGHRAVDQHRLRGTRAAARRLQGARHHAPPRPAPGRRRPDRPTYAPQYILGASDVSPQGVATAYGVARRRRQEVPGVAVTKVTQGSKELAQARRRRAAGRRPRRRAGATDKFLEYNMTNGSGIRNQLAGGRASRPARPAPPTTTTSRGSSATRRSSPPPSGSARPTTATSAYEERHRRWHLLPRHARRRDRRPDLEGHHERLPRGPADRAVHGAVRQADAAATRSQSRASPACGRRGDRRPSRPPASRRRSAARWARRCPAASSPARPPTAGRPRAAS